MLSFFDPMPQFKSQSKHSPINLEGSISYVMKATWITLILFSSFLFGSVSLFADDKKKDPTLADKVEGEIARRQAQMIEAEKIIAEGDQLITEGNYKEALSKFAKAYNGMNPSPTSDAVRNQARQKYIGASVLRAKELIDDAEFVAAEELLDQVLQPSVAPNYRPAVILKKRLQDPEWYNQARTPEHLANVKRVTRLLKLASGATKLGDLDKALKYYADILRIDKTNTSARRGMEETEQQIVNYHKSSRDHTREKLLGEIDEAWENKADISAAFGIVGGNTSGSEVDESIERKMSAIVIESINFEDETLEDVVNYLTIKSKQLDPIGGGINFVLKLDPSDLVALNARVNLALRNIPIGEVLKQITNDTGTKYKLDTYAVQIVSRASESKQLVTKTFRVPPDFLSTASIGDEGDDGGDPFSAEGNNQGGLKLKRLGAKEFLMKQGITFPEGASAIFVPGSSSLVARNTISNIELIETFIDSSFNDVPKQVEVHVTMVDISQKELNELGFDWLLGQFNVPSSQRIFAGGGTIGNAATTGSGASTFSEYTFIPPWTDVPLGDNPITSGLRTGGQWREGDALNDILLGGGGDVAAAPSTLKSPAIFGVGGAFSDPQFQTVIRGLAQAKGADMITRPSIVTRSGQRASVDITRDFPYPTEYDPPEIPQDGGAFGGFGVGDGAPPSFPVTPAHPTSFEVRNVGTHLEVEPIVGADNYTIELNLAPEFNQFEGFINYGTPIMTTGTNILGEFESIPLSDNRVLQPVFRTLRTNTSVVVWDGATVVFGGLIEDRAATVEDKVPFLGDLPFIGRLFKSKGKDRLKRAVLFFVKVNIIDPSGKRINSN